MPKNVLLFDADVLIYQSCAAVENIVCWEADCCFPIASKAQALALFDERVDELCSALDASYDDCVLCISDNINNNFRRNIYSGYKSNRDGKPRPVALRFVREDILQRHNTFFYPSVEADDVLGILSTHPDFKPGDRKIIVSVDKDLKTIPGYFYAFNKENPEVVSISEKEADKWFMIQALTGDTTDGYKGCPGIGPVKAKALLESAETIQDMWNIVLAAYDNAGLNEDYALTMARLARILRHTDYDQRTRQVKLWNPY